MKSTRNALLILVLGIIWYGSVLSQLVPVYTNESAEHPVTHENDEEGLSDLQFVSSDDPSYQDYLDLWSSIQSTQSPDDFLVLADSIPLQMSDIDAQDMCTGGYSTVVLLKDGTVMQYGLGMGEGQKVQFANTGKITPKIHKLFCGDYFTIGLTKDGKMYSWGRDNVLLGHNDDVKEGDFTSIAQQVVGGDVESKEVISVAAGYEHVVAVTSNRIKLFRFNALEEEGRVYSWGNNNVGQLGQGSNIKSIKNPSEIKAASLRTKHIVDTCAGTYHTVLLTEDQGEVYVFGTSTFGQLGMADSEEFSEEAPTTIYTPVKNPFLQNITKLSCGGDHTFAIGVNGVVYAWGWNEYGQLGTHDIELRDQPTVVNLNDIALIEGSKYAHSLAVTTNGDVFVFGSNDHGQLGARESSEFVLDPINIKHLLNNYSTANKIVKVDAGYRHSAMLTDTGVVIVFGDKVFNQLGHTTSLRTPLFEGKVEYKYTDYVEPREATEPRGIEFGAAAHIGGRADMEDRMIAIQHFGGKIDRYYFGVYDGHGGHIVANDVTDLLHKNILAELVNQSQPVEYSILFAYQATDDQLRARSKSDTTGSTATSILIEYENESKTKADVWIANIGDSRAIFSENGEATQLTYEHRATDEREVERIRSAGGVVVRDRVRGVLAVTRAFGDFFFDKTTEVLPTPYISKLTFTREENGFNFVIIASDGLWDVFSNDEVARTVYLEFTKQERSNVSESQRLEDIAKMLVEAALQRKSQDNVSVLITKL